MVLRPRLATGLPLSRAAPIWRRQEVNYEWPSGCGWYGERSAPPISFVSNRAAYPLTTTSIPVTAAASV